MKPISRGMRRIYLVVFTLLFIMLVPTLILYALGYRFASDWSIFSTGGIYIASDQSGAEIYLNNKLVSQTSYFRRGYFIQNLRRGNYFVIFAKQNFRSWSKHLDVLDQKVTEAYAFNMPNDPVIRREIPEFTKVSVATSTLTRPNAFYTDLLIDFAERNLQSESVLGLLREKDRKKVVLWQEGNKVHARWTGAEDAAPYFFCNGTCHTDVVVYESPSPIKYFDFFPNRNDLILLANDSGVYVTEIDVRPDRNIQPVYEKGGVDFIVENGNILYVKDGSRVLEVETAF
ncbi:hypothetical protein KW783_00525 [Candidatus Parcubacteria bacterium]|nr:hypothetical protein [Candidatus Parcubacteria bacterium]